MSKNNLHVLGITGMPGSGKSVFAQFARECGYHIVVMGDVIRETARSRGLEPTQEACREMMIGLRKERGETVVAQLTFEKIEKLYAQGYNKFVIDGIRSQAEVEYFREKLSDDFYIIAVHVDPNIRFKRLKERGRADAPQTEEDFRKRDETELSVGVGETIAFSNFIISNNGSIEEFQKQAYELLNAIEKGEAI
ncbi:MAG: AAA family ATPase [Candidatus Heimdallarchaeaceae archaeon]